jgi:hypothetical protein
MPAHEEDGEVGTPETTRAVESSLHHALRTGVGCLALLWVFPGLFVALLGVWGIEGDAPSSASVQQANVFLVVYLLGLIGLPVWWTFLRRQGLEQRRRELEQRRRELEHLDRLRAAGQVSETTDPFERAKLELEVTGKRRVFVCGRCGKGVSLGWKQCEHTARPPSTHSRQ